MFNGILSTWETCRSMLVADRFTLGERRRRGPTGAFAAQSKPEGVP